VGGGGTVSAEGAPRVGVCTCLLGEKVRFDGGDRLDRYVTGTLAQHVAWVPVCPETESGLSVPREPMRQVGDPDAPLLLGWETDTDFTERLSAWSAGKVAELEGTGLSGFVLKTRSPSCGLRGVKVYPPGGGVPGTRGVGIFARALMDGLGSLPVIDEELLGDIHLRDNWLTRLFVRRRWLEMLREGGSLHALVEFHGRHKLLLMAHSPERCRELGRLVARGKEHLREELLRLYIDALMDALHQLATRRKNVNVLYHAMGYFKKDLKPDEKMELLELMSAYHLGKTPLLSPLTLINHYARTFGVEYLQKQVYLNPDPAEAALRFGP
jgi:uncharacterized protein YbgA (DUF1722 family)/uncharacterized protein YbbK (DUF523 family)